MSVTQISVQNSVLSFPYSVQKLCQVWNGRDLTEAEDIKYRWQEYTELYKKDLHDPMNCSMPDLPVHHQLPELAQTHVH